MTKMLPKLCLTMLLSGLALAPAMSALAQSKSTAEAAALQGDARSQELIDAAKKEGELNIYLAHPSVPSPGNTASRSTSGAPVPKRFCNVW